MATITIDHVENSGSEKKIYAKYTGPAAYDAANGDVINASDVGLSLINSVNLRLLDGAFFIAPEYNAGRKTASLRIYAALGGAGAGDTYSWNVGIPGGAFNEVPVYIGHTDRDAWNFKFYYDDAPTSSQSILGIGALGGTDNIPFQAVRTEPISFKTTHNGAPLGGAVYYKFQTNSTRSGVLVSNLAGGDVAVEDTLSNYSGYVYDDKNPTDLGMPIYVDDGAADGSRWVAVNPEGVDMFATFENGQSIKIVHDAGAAGNPPLLIDPAQPIADRFEANLPGAADITNVNDPIEAALRVFGEVVVAQVYFNENIAAANLRLQANLSTTGGYDAYIRTATNSFIHTTHNPDASVDGDPFIVHRTLNQISGPLVTPSTLTNDASRSWVGGLGSIDDGTDLSQAIVERQIVIHGF